MNCIDFINERFLVALFPILDIEARNALKVLNVGGVKQITGHNYQVSTVREDSTFSLRSISA